MKKIFTNYRYYVLLVLTAITIIGIFAVPDDNLPIGNWFYTLVSTKVIGFTAGYVLVKLTNRWEAKGTIEELTKFTNSI